MRWRTLPPTRTGSTSWTERRGLLEVVRRNMMAERAETRLSTLSQALHERDDEMSL